MTYVKQEGGDHYQAEYQHWDWVRDVGLGYLAGCATKYVSRWWKKNGLQDLLKARTYLEKMMVSGDTTVDYPENIDEINKRFVKSNQLPNLEAHFCCAMVWWEGPGQPEYLLTVLDRLIEIAKGPVGQGQTVVAPTLAATPGDASKTPADGRFLANTGQAVGHRPGVDGMEHPFGYDEWHEGGLS